MADVVLEIHWDGNGIARITAATEALAGPKKTAVLRRAINHTGDKVYTIVVRTLAKQIGAPAGVIKRYGQVTKIRASNATLTYMIRGNGGPIPLKHFRAYQTRKGVSAAPWHNRKTYKSAFIVGSLGGHAFWRRGRKRLPIERIAGPNVPKEMVKDATAAAFQ
ncbi:MAG: hypothetical protein ACK4TP_10250, partial [Hyphomicrobium sp.]